MFLNIELKGQNTVQELSKVIKSKIENKLWQYKKIIVSSFQHNLLKDLYQINKQIPLGILTDTSIDEAILIAEQLKAIAIHPSYTMLTKGNVKKYKQKAIKCTLGLLMIKTLLSE